MGRLNELGVFHGTDKSSLYHNYLDWYEKKIKEFFKTPPQVIVEIGVKDGASLRMWRDYFPGSLIIGIDITNPLKIEGVKCYQFDATNNDEWEKIFSCFDFIPLIVEDASHITSHQMKTWNIIRQRWFSNNNSMFIMEDIHTSFIKSYIDTEQTTYEYLLQKSKSNGGVEFYQRDKNVFHDSMTGIITSI